MEKSNLERVIAYQLSQEITHEDMDEIAGGAHPPGYTIQYTNKNVSLNGQSIQSVDGVMDF